ncbi:PAS domain-containing sensor histidine kinase [Labilibacter sediminis]|nr:PAS domain-containing sensor histidine kinase [Labilibacter sediminis]
MESKLKEEIIGRLRVELEHLKMQNNDLEFDRVFSLLQQLEPKETERAPSYGSEVLDPSYGFEQFNQLLKTVLDSIPEAVFWKDANFKFKYGNKKFLQVIGYNSLVDIKGKTDYDLNWPQKQCDHFRADDVHIIKSKKPKTGILEQLTKADGSTIWLRTNKAPIISIGGEVEGIIGFIQDVTESRATKQALKHSEARLKSYFNNATDGIVVLNDNFDICEANEATERITGMQNSQLLNSTLFDLLSMDEYMQGFEAACRTMDVDPVSWEGSVVAPDGHLKFVKLDVIKIEIDHYICFIKDISELKMAVKKAEESNRLKTAFLQNISHEIRTPLNAIIGFSNVLMRGMYDSEEDANHYKQIIHSNSNYLLGLINSVIDLSKIESGQTNLNPQPVKVVPFIANEVLPLIESERIRLKRDEVKILFDTDGVDTNVEMIVDNQRLKQIIINLMQNSLKFTEKGSVKLRIEVILKTMRFTVIDTGIGIPKEQVNRVFHRFYKVQDSSKISQGSGLGLAIVKKLLRVMKGFVEVDSELGKGTVFTVELPMGN